MNNNDKSIESKKADDCEAIPLILPEDFDLPSELEQRILKEMADLNKELDEEEKKKPKHRSRSLKLFTRVAAAAAVVALIAVLLPWHNRTAKKNDDSKVPILNDSSDVNSFDEIDSYDNHFYIISDTDFKGGIANGDTLCIVPSGNRDSVPIKKKIVSVTNRKKGRRGRDYFHASVTDSNRIILSVDSNTRRHAHLYVWIYYEDGSVYENEWDLITSAPRVRFNPPEVKKFVGDVFEPKYYLVVLDEDENVKTVNYLKGSGRISWYTNDNRYVDQPRFSIDENGTITCLEKTYGFTTVVADVEGGYPAVLKLKISSKS